MTHGRNSGMERFGAADAFEAELVAIEKPFVSAGYFPNTQLRRALEENDGDPIQWVLSVGIRRSGGVRHFRGATIGECLRAAQEAVMDIDRETCDICDKPATTTLTYCDKCHDALG